MRRLAASAAPRRERVLVRYDPGLSMSGWKQMLRRLVREPGFSTVIVLTLALALAAVVTVFTLVNDVLLRQLPYPESAHLVEVSHDAPGLKLEKMGMSPRLYLHYLEHSKTLAGIALSSSADFTLSGGEEPVRVPGAVVSPS